MGFIAGSTNLVTMILSEAFFLFRSLKQQSGKSIQLRRAQGVKKCLDDDFLNGRPIQRHTDGSCIMAFEPITQVANM